MTNATEYVQRIQNNIHQKDTDKSNFYKPLMNLCLQLLNF